MELEKRLENYCREKNLQVLEKISKGYSSEVYLVGDAAGGRFALKIEKEKSPRKDMVKKEAENLKLANSAGVGPKLVDSDFERKIILMEFIEGKRFGDWMFSNPGKEILKEFLRELFVQAKKLDGIGLDHGQLAGKGRNILVRGDLPVIVDFEKASFNRKPHNVTTMTSFIVLNKKSAITEKIREILS